MSTALGQPCAVGYGARHSSSHVMIVKANTGCMPFMHVTVRPQVLSHPVHCVALLLLRDAGP